MTGIQLLESQCRSAVDLEQTLVSSSDGSDMKVVESLKR